jgi:MarR family transcriptional regulator, negative regulator of the multidrug operon emrRAB
MAHPRADNILGALVLSLSDGIKETTEQQLAMRGEAAAAVVSIGNSPGNSIGWLSKTLMLSHSGTVRLLDKLVHEGLVERNRVELDAREASLHLTNSGERKMLAILKSRHDCLDTALDALTKQEQLLFCKLSEKILAAISRDERGDAMCRLCEESVCPQNRCPVTLACQANVDSQS